MIDPAQVHRHAPLATTNLRLDRLGPEHLEGSYSASRDPETRRLSGNHNDDTREQYETRLAVQRDSPDRADWAILRASDGVYVGEASLFRFDVHNQSMEFQIALGGPALFGRGYGSEAAKAVVDYGFDVVGPAGRRLQHPRSAGLRQARLPLGGCPPRGLVRRRRVVRRHHHGRHRRSLTFHPGQGDAPGFRRAKSGASLVRSVPLLF
jgi:hypothetical protein